MVLGPVDEDLALAFDLFHLRDDLVRGLLLEQLGDRFGERFGRLVVDFVVERDVDLQALGARGLREALDPEVAEHLAQAQRRPGSSRRCPPAGRGRGRRRARSAVSAPAPARARGAARSPPAAPSRPASAGRRRRRSRSCRRAGPASTRAVFTHFGRCLGQRFSKKAASRSSTPSGKRRSVTARRQMGDDRRRHLGVVVDHLPLGEAGLRVEDLVEVGELQLTPVDLDLAVEATGYFEDFARALELRLGGRFLAFSGAGLCAFFAAALVPLTAAMLSSSAAIRSGALVASAPRRLARRPAPCPRPCVRSSPAAPRGTRRGRRRGRSSAVSESISFSAISTSRLATFGSSAGSTSSSSPGGTTSSAKRIVVRVSTPSPGGSPPGAPCCGRRSARSPTLPDCLHRLGQQRVGLLGAVGGAQVVGAVEVDRVDLAEVDEVLDLDRARLLRGRARPSRPCSAARSGRA